MSSVLICPNPECKQALATSTLPGRFRCSRCGWVLQIRFTPTGVVLQQASGADSGSQIALAPAVNPAEVPTELAATAGGPVLQPPPERGSNLVLYLLLGILVFMVLAGIVIVAIVIASPKGVRPATPRSTAATPQGKAPVDKPEIKQHYEVAKLKINDEVVVQLLWSPDTWKEHEDLMDKFEDDTALALERRDGSGWLLIVVNKFDLRDPRDQELFDEGQYYAARPFVQRPDKSPLADGKFLGERALRFQFKGKMETDGKEVKWFGVCYAVAYRGLGYWLFAASTSYERAENMIAGLQSTKPSVWTWPASRAAWSAKPPEYKTFKGAKQPCTLQAIQDIALKWKELPDLADHFPDADLGIYAAYPGDRFKEKKGSQNDATALVVVSKTDAKNARAALEEFIQKDLTEEAVGENTDKKLLPVEAAKEKDVVEVKLNGKSAAVAERKLVFEDTEPRRYYLIAVVVEGGSRFVLRCDCPWEVRAFWKKEFEDLLSKFQVGG
jgi:hypothetical protein